MEPVATSLTECGGCAAASALPSWPPEHGRRQAAHLVALHGTVTLRTSLPGFPWPDPGVFIRKVVLSLAGVTGR
jgi:hypothetical protein